MPRVIIHVSRMNDPAIPVERDGALHVLGSLTREIKFREAVISHAIRGSIDRFYDSII